MRKRLLSVLAVPAALLVGIAACSDMGDEQPLDAEPIPALAAMPSSVSVGPGQGANVSISGGMPPYVIAEPPDTALATAVIPVSSTEPSVLVITGVTVASAAGSTTVRVRDSSPAPQRQVSIPITKLP